MKKPLIASVVIFLVFAGIVVYAAIFLDDLVSKESTEGLERRPEITQAATQRTSVPTASAGTISIDEILSSSIANWKTYTTKNEELIISYPDILILQHLEDKTFQLRYQNNLWTKEGFLKEGMVMEFVNNELGKMSFDELLEQVLIQQQEKYGTQNVSTLEEVNLANTIGYRFSIARENLPDITYFYIPESGRDEYIVISAKTADPQNKGYNKLQEKVLSTLIVN